MQRGLVSEKFPGGAAQRPRRGEGEEKGRVGENEHVEVHLHLLL